MNTSANTSNAGAAREGRIPARPHPPADTGRKGLHALGLDVRRDAWVYVPQRYDPARPAPLILSLHGAGGQGKNHLGHLIPLSDKYGVVLLAPTSRQGSWDVIYGSYGPDITVMGRALEETFNRYAIDPRHLGIEGFSDGASYALSVGLTNGELFTCILAFSPGFMAPAAQHGRPRIFISHGTQDPVLGIDSCSRRLVPQLERAGYDVRYVEFDGGHTVPESIAEDGVRFFLDLPSSGEVAGPSADGDSALRGFRT